jgi:hypothetical protein
MDEPTSTNSSITPHWLSPHNRDWSSRERAFWWVKFISMTAGAIVALAGAASVLGVRIDVQTKTEARAQHEALKKALRDEEAPVLERIEAKIDRTNDRIDAMTTAIISSVVHREK